MSAGLAGSFGGDDGAAIANAGGAFLPVFVQLTQDVAPAMDLWSRANTFPFVQLKDYNPLAGANTAEGAAAAFNDMAANWPRSKPHRYALLYLGPGENGGYPDTLNPINHPDDKHVWGPSAEYLGQSLWRTQGIAAAGTRCHDAIAEYHAALLSKIDSGSLPAGWASPYACVADNEEIDDIKVSSSDWFVGDPPVRFADFATKGLYQRMKVSPQFSMDICDGVYTPAQLEARALAALGLSSMPAVPEFTWSSPWCPEHVALRIMQWVSWRSAMYATAQAYYAGMAAVYPNAVRGNWQVPKLSGSVSRPVTLEPNGGAVDRCLGLDDYAGAELHTCSIIAAYGGAVGDYRLSNPTAAAESPLWNVRENWDAAARRARFRARGSGRVLDFGLSEYGLTSVGRQLKSAYGQRHSVCASVSIPALLEIADPTERAASITACGRSLAAARKRGAIDWVWLFTPDGYSNPTHTAATEALLDAIDQAGG